MSFYTVQRCYVNAKVPGELNAIICRVKFYLKMEITFSSETLGSC
jgi:hypothetical protein